MVGVLKEGFPSEHFDEHVEQATCMLEALRRNLWLDLELEGEKKGNKW